MVPASSKDSHLSAVIEDNIIHKLRGGPINTSESSRQLSRIINSFSESCSYLYELIQNADDACSTNDLRISIGKSDTKIIFAHNAKSFSAPDINSICSTGIERTDPQSKSLDTNQIGYKGVGFKSVFKISDNVKVFSGDFCFEFNRRYWEQKGIEVAFDYGWQESEMSEWEHHCDKYHQRKIVEFPWQTLPIICKDEKPHGYEDFNVVVVIEIAHGFTNDLNKEVSTILSSADYLLFLNTPNISVDIEGNTQRKTKRNNVTTLKSDSSEEDWDIKSSSLPIERNIIPKDFPPKMAEIDETTISIAVRLNDKGEIINLKERQIDIYSFLPTSESYELPFIINGQFAVDNARERLDKDNEWNMVLFEGAGKLLANTIEKISADEILHQFALRLIPDSSYASGYEKSLTNSAIKQLKNKAFLPVKGSSVLRTPNEVVLDKTGISNNGALVKLISVLLGLEDEKYIVDNSILKATSRLVHFDIPTLTSHDLKECFSKEKTNAFLADQSDAFFVQLLEEFSKSEIEITYIKEIPFLRSSSETITSPEELFLFDDSGNSIYQELSLKMLSRGVYDTCDYFLRKWIIDELGINSPDPESIVSRSRTYKWQNRTTNLNIIRYLYNKKDFIRNWDDLSNLRLITLSGDIKSKNELYLSDGYLPIHKLEKHLPKEDIFISLDYCEDPNEYEEWGSFFSEKLGISSSISIKNLTKKGSVVLGGLPAFYPKASFTDHLLKQYVEYSNKDYDENVASINPDMTTRGDYKTKNYLYNVQYIRFLDKIETSNTEFTSLFWEVVFSDLSEEEGPKENSTLSEKKRPKYWWYERAIFRTPHYLKNINLWAIQDSSVFPCSLTRQNKKATDLLYPNKENRNLGKYLPVLDTQIPEDLINYEIEGGRLLRFRTKPTQAEIIQAMNKLREESASDLPEIQKTIGLLYQIIIDINSLDLSDNDYLLTVGGSFQQKKDIIYIENQSLRGKIVSKYQIYIPSEYDKISENKLIGALGLSPTNIEISGGIKDDSLKAFLESKEKLIQLLMTECKTNDGKQTFPSFDILAHPKMEITFQSEQLEICAFLDKTNNLLHVLQDWKEKRKTQKQISEAIADNLNIELLNIDDILWRRETDIIEEWEEEGREIPEGTKSYYFKRAIIHTSEQEHLINKLPNDDTGRLSEEKVFRKLVLAARKMSPNLEKDLYEKYLYKNENIKIEWARGNDPSADYDIKIEERINGKVITQFFEVKSISGSKFNRQGESLFFSDLEWNRMYHQDDITGNYFLAIVFNNRNRCLEDGDMNLVRVTPELDLNEIFRSN